MTSDTSHPFFRPLWRRIAVVAFCLAWSTVEWANGQTGWGLMTLAIAAYGVWAFFIAYKPSPEGETQGASHPAPPPGA